MASPHDSIPYPYRRLSLAQMRRRQRTFARLMATRRSIREFSADPVPRDLVDNAIRTAAMAPSGANRQPWTFVVVGDADLKRRIRAAAEEEERRNYEGGRFPERWLRALEPLGTDWHKPYLEIAPWLVVCFRQDWCLLPDGGKENNYYVPESVGIACGLFIASLHAAGLVTVTHTPSPMGFLSLLLKRPANEKPYILFPVGYPAPGARVPRIERKAWEEIVQEDDRATETQPAPEGGAAIGSTGGVAPAQGAVPAARRKGSRVEPTAGRSPATRAEQPQGVPPGKLPGPHLRRSRKP